MAIEMKTLDLSELQPGIVLPTDINDGNNPELLLLGEGNEVTQKQIQQLIDRGIQTISVNSEFLDFITKPTDATPEESVRCEEDGRGADYDDVMLQQNKKRLSNTSRQLRSFYSLTTSPGTKNGDTINGISLESYRHMVEDIDTNVHLAIVRDSETQEFDHCVRVSHLAMAIAKVMDREQSDVINLGIGCLMSRYGYSEKIQELQSQKRKLTYIEKLEFSKNPIHMFHAFENVRNLPSTARQVAYQINERWDGSGYPRKIRGKQIHLLSRIAAVADVFIALTSDRPHRKAYLAYEAVEIILKQTKEGKFDPNAVRGLFQTISLYPIGSHVLLNNGSIAVVLRSNHTAYDKPVVKIISDADGDAVDEKIIDLSQQPEVAIVKVIDNEAIDKLKAAKRHLKSQNHKKMANA